MIFTFECWEKMVGLRSLFGLVCIHSHPQHKARGVRVIADFQRWMRKGYITRTHKSTCHDSNYKHWHYRLNPKYKEKILKPETEGLLEVDIQPRLVIVEIKANIDGNIITCESLDQLKFLIKILELLGYE